MSLRVTTGSSDRKPNRFSHTW